MARLKTLCACKRAATAVEYGLILALVFIAIAASVGQLSSASNNMWNNVSSNSTGVL
jgi:pilus assembly protein Flp/PilA